MDYVIGVDLDNTLVSYDDVIYSTAIQQGWIEPGVGRRKIDVRDRIRELPGGELKWQRLQAIVYGMRMEEARLIDGVQEFFKSCSRYRVRTYIISHKTEYVKLGETNINLREAALAWMKKNNFFVAEGLGLSSQDVYFELTRREKIARIRKLKCTHFIDDLEETFLEDSFPSDVEKILYAPHIRDLALPGIRVISSWREMGKYFFDSGK